MANKSPQVSVIMPVLNEEHHLVDAVASVLAQNFDGELLIALGPSADGTDKVAAKLAKADSRIRLVPNPRGLTTVGMNLCIKLAKHDYIVRVDAHSEPAPNYISRGVEILNETGADLLGGVMAARGKTLFQRSVAWAYNSRFGLGGAAYHVGGKAGEAESAYLGIFRKSALTRVGGYDESIVRGEDWDLAQRIKTSGSLVWFSPELVVVYWPRSSWSGLAKQFYSTGVWRGELTKRDLARTSPRYFIPPALVLALALGNFLGVLGFIIGWIPTLGYVAAILAVAVQARLAPVPLVLATMHLSWGFGFIVGLIRGAAGTIDRSRVTK
ncbi:MAG: glycosyltransferase family 2 protein [Rhodoluna sp.]|nr:glycosyltransferase family 2 protein [Rhodoluna sp.]